MTNKRRHRGSRRQFWLANNTIHVEVFWHHGYRKMGAEVYHQPSGTWDIVYGAKGSLFKKIRQLAIWLAHPEVRKVSERILGKQQTKINNAKFWCNDIHIDEGSLEQTRVR